MMPKSCALFSSTAMMCALLSSTAIAHAVGVSGPEVHLNNGMIFPSVSFGLQVYDDDTAEKLTTLALEAGIRNYFSSVLAGNQQGFGSAIAKTSVPRSDIFICGSVNTGNGMCSGKDDCKSQTADGCKQNLEDIGVEQLDMIMLDYPASDCDSIQGQWEAFEDMLKANQTLSIAVSNFNPDQLDCLLKAKMTTPAVNQVQYSVIGSGSDTSVDDDMSRGGVIVQGYSPLSGGAVLGDPIVQAVANAHNKSAAQVGLRWILQRNATFTTSASSLEHFKEDLDIFDFSLTRAEMQKLDKLTR